MESGMAPVRALALDVDTLLRSWLVRALMRGQGV